MKKSTYFYIYFLVFILFLSGLTLLLFNNLKPLRKDLPSETSAKGTLTVYSITFDNTKPSGEVSSRGGATRVSNFVMGMWWWPSHVGEGTEKAQSDNQAYYIVKGWVPKNDTTYIKSGYEFAGFYSDSACKNRMNTIEEDGGWGTDQIDISNSSRTIYAMFRPSISGQFWYYCYTNGSSSTTGGNLKNSNSGADVGNTSYIEYSKYNVFAPYAASSAKTGYVFNGWYKGNTTSSTIVTTSKSLYTGQGDVAYNGSYYAHYTGVPYTIAFNGNGNTGGSMSNLSMTYGVAKNLTANAFTKTGYTFAGWNTEPDGTGIGYSNQASVKNLLSTRGATINLHAQWTPNKYDIYFNTRDGVGGTGSAKATYNSPMPSITRPTKEGYTFGGYFTEDQGKGTKYYNADGSSARKWDKTDWATLYAYWTANRYDITFDDNGGKNGLNDTTMNVAYGVKTTNLQKLPNLDGYTFKGYYDAKSNGTQYYNNSGVNVKAWDKASDGTLYAQWAANTYKITFHSNPPTYYSSQGDKTKTQELTYDTAANLTSTPFTMEGFTFKGWATTDSSTTVSYEDHASVKNLTTTKGDNIHLYAVWEENTYTIKFNGGTGGSMADMKNLRYTQIYTLPDCTLTKAGYQFTHYTYNSDNYYAHQTVVRLSSTNDATVTMTAQWQDTWANHVVVPVNNQIASAGNLAWLARQDNLTGIYIQTKDIDMSDYKWKPIQNFQGTYDGQGYAIKNLTTLTVKSNYNQYVGCDVGLFGSTNNATIKNVNLISGSVYGRENVGGLVGEASGGLITNCKSHITVNGYSNAGMIGNATNVKIESCYNYGNITSSFDYAGGIVGYTYGSTISSCLARCNVSGTNSGGIVGGGSATVTSSGFNGSAEYYIGSFIGSITNCVAIEGCTGGSFCGNERNCVTCYNAKADKPWIGGEGNAADWRTANGQKLPIGLVF